MEEDGVRPAFDRILPNLPRLDAGASLRRTAPLLATFVAAIFVSAALLFAVQPMFTKMVLPQLGGAASVWSVAMVFFQTALLAGYAYAHLLTRLAPGRTSIFIHLAVMVAACLALPLHIATGWRPAAAVGRGVLAPRAVCGFDRAAVLRARSQWAAAAGVVRAHRSPGGEGPVFPLCREQCRKLSRARLLSCGSRAFRAARLTRLGCGRSVSIS